MTVNGRAAIEHCEHTLQLINAPLNSNNQLINANLYVCVISLVSALLLFVDIT